MTRNWVGFYNGCPVRGALLNKTLCVGAKVAVSDRGVWPAVSVGGALQQFFRATATGAFIAFDDPLDAAITSDEGGRGDHAGFTGAFVGMVAQDLTGQGWSALVLDFSCQPL